MRKYETIFILKPNLEEGRRVEMVEKFKAIISGAGEVKETNEMGIKKLAYEIEKFKEGYYVLINFVAKPDLPKELERVFRITDDVIRYIVINTEE